MKKFAILLLAMLAVNYSVQQTPTCGTTTNHGFYARLLALDSTWTVITAAAGDADSCTAGFGNLCCHVAKTRAIVQSQIEKVKATIKNFGDKVSKVGSQWAKIHALMTATAITGTTTPAAALEAATDAERSGATAAEFKAFNMYTGDAFKTDFDNFKGQASGCLTAHSTQLQKLACAGCKIAPAATPAAPWISATLAITPASASEWVAACNKVWYFMWKVGWFAQTVAFLNNKKATAAYTSPAAADVYYRQSAVTVANINGAFEKCYPDAAATVTACDATMRANLVRAFVHAYGASTISGLGRSSTAIVDSTFASNGRRVLQFVAWDGTLDVADAGVALSTMAAGEVYKPTAAVVDFTDAEKTAWSHAYSFVAPTTTGTGTGTVTVSSKNAQVLFGTVLSFLAVALLN